MTALHLPEQVVVGLADRQSLGALLEPQREAAATVARDHVDRMPVDHRRALNLPEQRRIALDTMRLLDEFQPRLVGSVLKGTATNYSDINLHLFADRSESVAIRLLEIGIPHEFYERRVKMDAERSVNYPALRFDANGRTVDATVFPIDGIRQSPYSPVDGRPMKRADLREVSELIDSN